MVLSCLLGWIYFFFSFQCVSLLEVKKKGLVSAYLRQNIVVIGAFNFISITVFLVACSISASGGVGGGGGVGVGRPLTRHGQVRSGEMRSSVSSCELLCNSLGSVYLCMYVNI